MAKEYTYKCLVEYSDGRTVPLESLPDDERSRLAELWGSRMAETLAGYYSRHPKEFERL